MLHIPTIAFKHDWTYILRTICVGLIFLVIVAACSSAVGQNPTPVAINNVGVIDICDIKIVSAGPFTLNSTEQRELDEFLVRWERVNAGIRRHEMQFNLFEYDPTLPGAVPNEPHRISFGHFLYTADPRQFKFVVEGEWVGEQRGRVQIRRDSDTNPHIFAETIIVSERAISIHNYTTKTVHQINASPERIEQWIAGIPLMLIIGASADDLNQRFSMRVKHRPDGDILLHARPLFEDRRNFVELVLLLEGDTLRPRGLKQYYRRGSKVFEFIRPRMNPIPRGFISPIIPRDWERVTYDWEDNQPFPGIIQVRDLSVREIHDAQPKDCTFHQ